MFYPKIFNQFRNHKAVDQIDNLLWAAKMALHPEHSGNTATGPGAVLDALDWTIATGRISTPRLKALTEARGAQMRDVLQMACQQVETDGDHSMAAYKDAAYAAIDRVMRIKQAA